jgi:hypothetical protein
MCLNYAVCLFVCKCLFNISFKLNVLNSGSSGLKLQLQDRYVGVEKGEYIRPGGLVSLCIYCDLYIDLDNIYVS